MWLIEDWQISSILIGAGVCGGGNSTLSSSQVELMRGKTVGDKVDIGEGITGSGVAKKKMWPGQVKLP